MPRLPFSTIVPSRQGLPLSAVVVAFLLSVPSSLLSQQVLLDAPVEAGELTLYPVLGADLEPGTDYYYVPNRARLARDARGRPEFSFLRYVENVRPGEEEETAREGEGGGIVHAVVQLDVEDSAVRAAERELGRERPGARIVGPVIYRSGTFGLVSSFLEEDGELTRRVVGLGAAPVLEGSRAAISMRLTKLGSKILWESFEMAQPDVSFVFEMEMEGLRAPLRARLEADWDRIYRHQAFQAAVAAPVLAGEVSAAFDDLRDTGAIRLVQVGADAQMEKLVAAAYDRLAKLMLEPVSGTGMPSLGQLGQGAGGGLLDRATTMLSAARAEAAARPGPPASRPATDRPAARPPGEDPPAEARDAEDARPVDAAADSGDDAADAASPERANAEAKSRSDAARDAPDRTTDADSDAAGPMNRDRKQAYLKLIWDREADYLASGVLPDFEAWADNIAKEEKRVLSQCLDGVAANVVAACEALAAVSDGMEQRLRDDLIPKLESRIETKRMISDENIDPTLLAEISQDERVDRLGTAWAQLASLRNHIHVQQEAVDAVQALLDQPGIPADATSFLEDHVSRGKWEETVAKNTAQHKQTSGQVAALQAEIGLTAHFPDPEAADELDPYAADDGFLAREAESAPPMDDILDRIERGLEADAAAARRNAPGGGSAELRLVDDPTRVRGIGSDDLWIANLGDSFSSGEGNPTTTGMPFNAWKWMDDEKCHRSKWGWPHIVADIATEHLQRPVYFTFLACSGGKLKEGLLESFTERGVDREPQLDRLERIVQAAGRVPDIVLLTGGGNDMGFADVVIECIFPGGCPGGWATDSLAARVSRLAGPEGLYAQVAQRLEAMGVRSDRVIFMLYPDPLFGRKRSGSGWGPNEVQVSCYIPAGPRMWTWASEKVVEPLQELQRERAAALGWSLADNHTLEYQKHSYCPRDSFRGGDSWWVGILSQVVKQWGLGAFHPNRRGHRELARSALLEIGKFMPDMPQISPRTEEIFSGSDRPGRGGGGSGADGGGGSGGAGGSGGGAGARGAPRVAVVAALQLRKVRQRGTFELDMSKHLAGSQPVTFTQPIGDLSRFKDDETVFREINLDQPLFRQREVAFRLDGLNAEDFGNYVNFVSVQLRRGEDVREELTVGAEQFNERGHDFRLLYGFSGEESRDEWMQYEYRTVWSLFGGLEVEAPWTRSQEGTVALPAPYVRRTIELEGSPAGLAGVPAVTVRLYYTVGEEERMTETVLRSSRGETVATADVLLPVEATEAGQAQYGYEIIWQYGNQDSRTTGRQVTSNPVLLLDPPPQ